MKTKTKPAKKTPKGLDTIVAAVYLTQLEHQLSIEELQLVMRGRITWVKPEAGYSNEGFAIQGLAGYISNIRKGHETADEVTERAIKAGWIGSVREVVAGLSSIPGPDVKTLIEMHNKRHSLESRVRGRNLVPCAICEGIGRE